MRDKGQEEADERKWMRGYGLGLGDEREGSEDKMKKRWGRW